MDKGSLAGIAPVHRKQGPERMDPGRHSEASHAKAARGCLDHHPNEALSRNCARRTRKSKMQAVMYQDLREFVYSRQAGIRR